MMKEPTPRKASSAPAAPKARRAASARALAAGAHAPGRADAAGDGAAPALLWQAFEQAVALLRLQAPVPVAWCSPAFAASLGLSPAQVAALPLSALCTRLDGLAAGLAALGTGTGDARARQAGDDVWHGAVRPGPASAGADGLAPGAAQTAADLHATLRRLPDGALALRLLPEQASERATRRHLEDRERLLFTSRSVAVGEMATTLAHELNQPLGAVTNVLRGLKARVASAQAAGQATPPPPGALAPLAQGVQLALDQVEYAARIIGRIRDYTQLRQPRHERVDVHALLHNSLTLLDWDLGRHGVQLSTDLAPPADGADGASVAGDGVMLQQVMVNLLRNAIDAMAGTPAGQRRLTIHSRSDDAGQLEIAIADTGCGIGEDGQAQLFTPFYSTKPTGMGIGLNICRSLIELHQGRLWFTPNEGGSGCTFHVALPLARGDEAAQLPRFMDAEHTPS